MPPLGDPSGTTTSNGFDELVEGLLFELLELPLDERAASLEDRCARHPRLADTLRRRYRLADEFRLLEGVTEEPGLRERFGPFTLIRELGQGVATVYLAHDERADRQVALKIFRSARLVDPDARARFQREARAASRLEHPGICPVYDAGEIDGTPYLSMRYVPGETLAAWLERQRRAAASGGDVPADRLRVLAWIEEVARTLHEAHRMGLVHRDVKPANIVITPEGAPVLIDFGVAQDAADEPPALAGQVVGTPTYMSPEQLAPRERPVGPATDVYALGATLYECLTLRPPFEAACREALHRAILHDPLPSARRFAPFVSRDLQSVLECAMAKEAGRRYPTAAAFADDLRRARRGEPVLVRRASIARRSFLWARRHRLVAGLSAALVAALAILLGVSLALDGERAAAAAALRDLDRAAVLVQLEDAEDEARELVPGWPEQVPRLERWVATRGEPLAARLADLELRLAALDDDPPRLADADIGAELADSLRTLVAGLRAFTAPERGTLARMQRRLAWAREVGRRTIDEHRRAWRETSAAIRASPRYGGLVLEPQLGLIPLGPDPASGLFEFYHLRSAWPGAPLLRRSAMTGRLVRHDGCGLVFVLVPGGRFTMGHEPDDPSPYATPEVVELEPFFLSKYEMTIAQWHRLSDGDSPSYFRVDAHYRNSPPITWQIPVERVSALMCDALLRQSGLCPPTEAQWEYACRAGTVTPWSFGSDAAAIARFENARDASYARYAPDQIDPATVPFDDGHALTAPVGSFLPNAFGFHDMHGNVREWCRDHWAPYGADLRPRPGDGLRAPDAALYRHRVLRGGSFYGALGQGKSGARGDALPDHRDQLTGLRPARTILQE